MNPVVLLNQLKGAILDLFFPPRCVGCGGRGTFLCPSCQASLPRLLPPLCTRCGVSLASGAICPTCEQRSLRIDGIRSPFCFEGPVRQAIHQLKYSDVKALAPPLAQLVGEYLVKNPLPAELLVPVPLHPRRLRRRGYNQSSLLARELARIVSIPLVEGELIRLRDAPPQARARSADERQSSVDRAFTCRGREFEGRRILLIDDVCTSGATLEACARAVKAAGAVSVWGLTVAREV